MRKNIYLLLATLLTFSGGPSFAAGKIQNADVKSLSELQAAGGTASQLINDSKIYVTGAGINKQLSAAIANGEIGGGGGGGYNLLTNSEFESGVSASWSNSGGTYAAATSTDILKGSVSAAFTASATGQYFESSAYTVPEILKSTNCYAEVWYKGGSSNLTLKVVDGTGTLIQSASVALVSSTAANLASVNFICPSSGSIKLRIESTGSSALASFDLAYLGQAKNIVSTSVIGDWKDFPSVAAGTLITAVTTSPAYGTVVENIAQYRRSGDSLDIRWSFKQSSAGTAGSGIYLFNIPSSICVIDTTKTGTNSSARNQRGAVGTWARVNGATAVANGTAMVWSSSQIYAEAGYTDSSSVVSAAPWGDAFSQFSLGSMSFSIRATVPCQGWSSNTSAARADQTNYGWTSYTPTFTGFGSPTAIETFHKRDGEDLLLRIKFTCGTTTATEARVSLPGSLVSAGTDKIPALRMIAAGTTVAGATTVPLMLIEPNVGYVTFGYRDGSSGGIAKANGSTICSLGSYYAFADARIPISGWSENQKAPVLIGSVTSGSTAALRVEYVSFGGSTLYNSTCASTPCTIWGQSGAISSVSRSSAGQYVINFLAGTWSVVPTCVYTGALTDHKVHPSGTVSAISVGSRDSSFAYTDGVTNQVICFGPR